MAKKPMLVVLAAGMGSAIYDMFNPAYIDEAWLTFLMKGVYGLMAGLVVRFGKKEPGILLSAIGAFAGAVSYAAAIPIIMGQNIGTCVTALLSSFGASKNARRAAIIHLSFNVIGTVVWLSVFSLISALFQPELLHVSANYLGIAVCHSAFNTLCTALLLPLSGLLEKLAYLVVPEGKETVKSVELDERRGGCSCR